MTTELKERIFAIEGIARNAGSVMWNTNRRFIWIGFLLFTLVCVLGLASNSVDSCEEGDIACMVPGWDDPLPVEDGAVTIFKSLDGDTGFITLFYTRDCPHCHEAMRYLDAWADQPHEFRWILQYYDITDNRENHQRLQAYLDSHQSQFFGVPMIFIGNRVIHGFQKGYTESAIKEAVSKLTGAEDDSHETITLPFIGQVDPTTFPLFVFTVVLGLLDGFNPCAMWVLMFLLGLLIHARSRRKVLMIGLIFVIASGVVYFGFMAAWFNLFVLLGFSRIITIILAIAAFVMGIINVKEFFMFKKGPSLMIPEGQKDKLFAKMRRVVQEKKPWLAIMMTIGLAFFVNLIELACTIGLPAIFTKTMVDRQIPDLQKWMYLVLYNVMYVIPLLVIVLVFAVTMGGKKLQEKHARVLKLMSGLLMLGLGVFLLIR